MSASSQANFPEPAPGTHYRRGLGLHSEIIGSVVEDYSGNLVRFARDHDYRFRAGDIQFRLAREFGFCYGVDRAIEYAYEARRRFPDRRIFITGEIIHNPYVNGKLTEKGVRFLKGAPSTEAKFEDIGPEDVVLLPAFGVDTVELEILRRRRAVLVDTTCGSVMNVWKNVERYKRDDRTAVVHGKAKHEETLATISRAGKFLVVLDLEEAGIVSSYIRQDADAISREAFLTRFAGAISPGFDPDRDLMRIGLANQTTMLSGESLEIARMLGEAIEARYGTEALEDRFRSFDTICSATQDRQDAVRELLREVEMDLVLVVGGFNSSNTTHLAEMCAEQLPAHHVSGPESLVSDRVILRQWNGSADYHYEWLPDGPVRIGLTSGASTPDIKLHETILRVLELRGLGVRDIVPD